MHAEPEYVIDPYEILLIREVWEVVDALPEAERALLLTWLHSRQDKPPPKVQEILHKIREKLGITPEPE